MGIYGAKPFINGVRTMSALEKMDEFFNARADTYDNHMLEELQLDEFYAEVCAQFPALREEDRLLDLGCGTGLELDRLFVRCRGLYVTGIDVSAAMLKQLEGKYPNKNLCLIQDSYFDVPFGEGTYDYVLSTYSLHHFSKAQKEALYQKIYGALKPSGIFVLGDYTVKTAQEEAQYLAESRLLLEERGLADGALHIDTPLTKDTETDLLRKTGFLAIRTARQWESTTILVAAKMR